MWASALWSHPHPGEEPQEETGKQQGVWPWRGWGRCWPAGPGSQTGESSPSAGWRPGPPGSAAGTWGRRRRRGSHGYGMAQPGETELQSSWAPELPSLWISQRKVLPAVDTSHACPRRPLDKQWLLSGAWRFLAQPAGLQATSRGWSQHRKCCCVIFYIIRFIRVENRWYFSQECFNTVFLLLCFVLNGSILTNAKKYIWLKSVRINGYIYVCCFRYTP